MVDLKGIEPSTLRMRTVRAPSCATGPYEVAYLNIDHLVLKVKMLQKSMQKGKKA